MSLYKNTDNNYINQFLSQASNSEHALDLSELGYGVANHPGTSNPEYTDATKNTEITSSGTGFTYKGNDPFQSANSQNQRPVSKYFHDVNQTTNSAVQKTINLNTTSTPSWAKYCRIVFAGSGGGGGSSNNTHGLGGGGGSGALFISKSIPINGPNTLDSISYYLGHGGTAGKVDDPDGKDGANSQLALDFGAKTIYIRIAGGLGGGGPGGHGSGDGGYFYAAIDPAAAPWTFPETATNGLQSGNIGVKDNGTYAYNTDINFYSSSLYGTANDVWKYYGWSSLGKPGASEGTQEETPGQWFSGPGLITRCKGGNLSQISENKKYLRSYILQNIGKGGDGGIEEYEIGGTNYFWSSGTNGKGAEIYIHWLPEDINLNADARALVDGLVTRFNYTDGTQKTGGYPLIGTEFKIDITMVGGGGGGGGSDSNIDEDVAGGGGGGGGGGSVDQNTFYLNNNTPLTVNTVFTYTVGGGGAGGRGGINNPGPPYIFRNPEDGKLGSKSLLSFGTHHLHVDGGHPGGKGENNAAGPGGGSGLAAGKNGNPTSSASPGAGGNGGGAYFTYPLQGVFQLGTGGNGGSTGNGGNGSNGGGGGGAAGTSTGMGDEFEGAPGNKGGNGGNGYIEIKWTLIKY